MSNLITIHCWYYDILEWRNRKFSSSFSNLHEFKNMYNLECHWTIIEKEITQVWCEKYKHQTKLWIVQTKGRRIETFCKWWESFNFKENLSNIFVISFLLIEGFLKQPSLFLGKLTCFIWEISVGLSDNSASVGGK